MIVAGYKIGDKMKKFTEWMNEQLLSEVRPKGFENKGFFSSGRKVMPKDKELMIRLGMLAGLLKNYPNDKKVEVLKNIITTAEELIDTIDTTQDFDDPGQKRFHKSFQHALGSDHDPEGYFNK
jgi:hypothetical protein